MPAILALGFVFVAHAQMPEDSAADLTPGQVDDMAAAWAAMHFLWAAPIILCWGSLGSCRRKIRS